MKRIKGENVGDDFPSHCIAGTRGTAVVCKGEHPMCTFGAHSAGTIAPPPPRGGSHWRIVARGKMCHSVPPAHSSMGTVALAEQASRGVQWHARTIPNARR